MVLTKFYLIISEQVLTNFGIIFSAPVPTKYLEQSVKTIEIAIDNLSTDIPVIHIR
jgi:hypothetical protein